MNIVIQCAASKNPDAGCLKRGDGKRVSFVADPRSAPSSKAHIHAHPDDPADTGKSWREELLRYNKAPGNNPLELLPAWRLYQNPAYEKLAERYGTERLFILSAGWGLIRGDFLTPEYDITFSNQAERYKRRRARDHYQDFRMLPTNGEPTVFFICKPYIPLACQLTEGMEGPRHLFYSSKHRPDVPGFTLKKYDTTTRTNWHYECADKFLRGEIQL